ncbi:MAG TPA: Rieske (2Fe-2S) protein, partial [Tepidisphaeraceae bacterium]|nr:Rieske (2Fe-2S) protein [Tepidisphaeraceae bacterium]
ESRSVWVHRSDANSSDAAAVAVRSPICPHLGCPVMLTPDGTQFCCPCHGGTFNASDGKRVAGPPPRDMDPMEFEIRDGHLWVRWQDFKIGVADRVAVTV